jgi:hypothetical protein
VASALILGSLVVVDPAHAEVAPPASWSSAEGRAMVDSTAHSIRYFGPDRYGTNQATNLALHGRGGYPFDSPDPATGVWGAKTCPRSIIVVAGDSVTDALAASSLSDPLDRSSQPRLTRVAAADPSFDVIGGLDRPDTAAAPIVITRPTRQGASGLSDTAKAVAVDLAHGGCTSAREAVIVGGSSSVPVDVESELVSLGYREVFRVGGRDRYETAADIARALGTGSGPSQPGCADDDVTDGSAELGWYGNAVAEFRSSPTSCVLLPRTVVLADGGEGADALAAGWWTSRWQVPVLLTAPDGSLPPSTRSALQALDVTALLVLGGAARIPESTVNEAAALAGGAIPGRVAGQDRYATSVAMAEQLGGWWPTGHAADFAGSTLCLASSGRSVGAADALTAGPWCAAAAATPSGGPSRLLPPANGSLFRTVGPELTRTHDAVPMLLVPPASPLTDDVASFLRAAFSSSDAWCDSVTEQACATPGFAVVFGGAASVSQAAVLQTADAVAGGTYGPDVRSDLTPGIGAVFGTTLDLGTVFAGAKAGSPQVCFTRGALVGVRWVMTAGPTVHPVLDVVRSSAYLRDGDGIARSPGTSRPLCWAEEGAALPGAPIAAVSLSGHRDEVQLPAGGRLTISNDLAMGLPRSSIGAPLMSDDPSGGRTDLVYSARPLEGTLTLKDTVAPITDMAMSLHLDRGVHPEAGDDPPDVVTGTLALTTSAGVVSGTIQAEARFAAGAWTIQGVASWTPNPSTSGGTGGFTAVLDASGLRWRADGYVG